MLIYYRYIVISLCGLILVGCKTNSINTADRVDTTSHISNDCKEIKSVMLSGKEFLSAGNSYTKIKTNLVNVLLLEGVKQTVGLQIKDVSSSSIQVSNDKINEEVKELSFQKAKGFINKFSVLEDKILNEGGEKLLYVSLNAEICMPKDRFTREMVVIGDIVNATQGNTKFKNGKDLITSAYFENARFDLINDTDVNTYKDWVITGKLINVKHRVTKSFSKTLGNALFQSVLVNGRTLGKIDNRVVRVTTTVYMQAENLIDKTIISDSLVKNEDFPVTAVKNGLTGMIDDHIAEVFIESTKNVFTKLVERPLNN